MSEHSPPGDIDDEYPVEDVNGGSRLSRKDGAKEMKVLLSGAKEHDTLYENEARTKMLSVAYPIS